MELMTTKRLMIGGLVFFIGTVAHGQLFEQLAKLSPTIPVGSGALKGPEFGCGGGIVRIR